MEKYFIVKNANLQRLVREWEDMSAKIDIAFREFTAENGLEAKKYYPYTDCLMLIPTENDMHRFGNQIKTDRRTFKKNSELGKKWVELCRKRQLRYMQKPIFELQDLVINTSCKFKTRLFSIGDTVYGSFSTDREFELSEKDFKELKASEFYKITESTGIIIR